jgi:hypothetical protein
VDEIEFIYQMTDLGVAQTDIAEIMDNCAPQHLRRIVRETEKRGTEEIGYILYMVQMGLFND